MRFGEIRWDSMSSQDTTENPQVSRLVLETIENLFGLFEAVPIYLDFSLYSSAPKKKKIETAYRVLWTVSIFFGRNSSALKWCDCSEIVEFQQEDEKFFKYLLYSIWHLAAYWYWYTHSARSQIDRDGTHSHEKNYERSIASPLTVRRTNIQISFRPHRFSAGRLVNLDSFDFNPTSRATDENFEISGAELSHLGESALGERSISYVMQIEHLCRRN